MNFLGIFFTKSQMFSYASYNVHNFSSPWEEPHLCHALVERRKYCRSICSDYQEVTKRQQLSHFFTVLVIIKVLKLVIQKFLVFRTFLDFHKILDFWKNLVFWKILDFRKNLDFQNFFGFSDFLDFWLLRSGRHSDQMSQETQVSRIALQLSVRSWR